MGAARGAAAPVLAAWLLVAGAPPAGSPAPSPRREAHGRYWPEASPDGREILYESPARGGPIHLAAADGTHERVLAPGTRAAWFPDGRRILAVVRRGSVDGLVILRRDGSAADTLPFTHARPLWRPRISPDGTRIVVGEPGPPSRPGLFRVLSLDGTPVRDLHPSARGEASEPTWSHDGRLAFVAFRRDRTGTIRSTDLYVMNADGTDEHRVATLPGGAQWITWSPDDRWIALQDDEEESGQIVVVEPATGTVRRIAPHVRPYLDETPSWSSDGHLYFQSDRGGTFAIYRMEPDGSGQTCLLGCSDEEP
ncbi:MAG TPA: hypothetical protein VKA44_07525 [Gemmatimonadota bacterium]|nr:hypothetical protein [Gemmatimonadota bacterium]